MVFSSILFLFRFFPIALLLYFAAPSKLKNLVLFVLSLFFYAWGEPVYVVLMIFSTIVDYIHGRLVEKFQNEKKTKAAKAAVASSVVINLALLCFFKYADFLVVNWNHLTKMALEPLKLPLPIGISFYTFQTMSYTIDVYRKEARAQKNIIAFGAYVALFPQLIAGPIVRYKTVSEQLNDRKTTFQGFAYGVVRFVTGLAKKVLLANNIGLLWEQMSASAGEITVLGAWIGVLAYAFQIYFDFSGYSDMAIGLGRMLGFQFDENFDYPYQSKSITEFWRRWHISLGTWFREYVYIPLGGNRCSKAKQIRNIFAVWALTGIWHGASWNFLAWGLYFCVILVLEKKLLMPYLERLPAVCRHLYAMTLVLISWVIFAFDNLSQGMAYLGKMFGVQAAGLWDMHTLFVLKDYGILFVVLILGATAGPKLLAQKGYARLGRYELLQAFVLNVFLVSLLLLSVAYIVDASYNPFLYFRF